jgi:hypothetical protein
MKNDQFKEKVLKYMEIICMDSDSLEAAKDFWANIRFFAFEYIHYMLDDYHVNMDTYNKADLESVIRYVIQVDNIGEASWWFRNDAGGFQRGLDAAAESFMNCPCKGEGF